MNFYIIYKDDSIIRDSLLYKLHSHVFNNTHERVICGFVIWGCDLKFSRYFLQKKQRGRGQGEEGESGGSDGEGRSRRRKGHGGDSDDDGEGRERADYKFGSSRREGEDGDEETARSYADLYESSVHACTHIHKINIHIATHTIMSRKLPL